MKDLRKKAIYIRKLLIECVGSLGVGHLGGSLSIVDLLTVLYHDVMKIDPQAPQMPTRDRLVLSKGHAGPALYATLVSAGYFKRGELLSLNQLGSCLPSHCNMQLTTGVDMTTGSLGQGLSCAVGMALGSRLAKDDAYIYAIIGDGESQEGQIWEAAMFAAQMELCRLIAFTDCNRFQIDGSVSEINEVEDLSAKWKAFGWNTFRIDGHDLNLIGSTIRQAKSLNEKPSMIILDTVKGKGVSFVENAGAANHNMQISKEQTKTALAELERLEGEL